MTDLVRESNWAQASRSGMDLRLVRQPAMDGWIFGRLSLDGVFECHCLENEEDVIPVGRYEVQLTFSQRFQRVLPILLNVPGRSGIRVHAGNSPGDSTGCILVGQDARPGWLGHSKAALEHLQPQLAGAQAAGGRIWLTIVPSDVVDPLNA